jgi:hypothetical protein
MAVSSDNWRTHYRRRWSPFRNLGSVCALDMEIVAAQFYCGEIAILGTKCIAKDKNASLWP